MYGKQFSQWQVHLKTNNGAGSSRRGHQVARREKSLHWCLHNHIHHHHHHHHDNRPRILRKQALRELRTLRPVNIKGNRARGMRAPKNTNQFLMHEKYQMLRLRCDSVGSDSDTDVADMDSYLRTLQQSRGSPLIIETESDSERDQAPEQDRLCSVRMLEDTWSEDSVQYAPSEDDVLLSQAFMTRDFLQVCKDITELL